MFAFGCDSVGGIDCGWVLYKIMSVGGKKKKKNDYTVFNDD